MKKFWRVNEGIQPTKNDYYKAVNLACNSTSLSLSTAMCIVLTEKYDKNVVCRGGITNKCYFQEVNTKCS